MKILSNKHIMTAGLVAPVLALMSYFAIDYLVGESPHAAEKGRTYQLAEKPDCRYASGSCGLKNGDFELHLVPAQLENGQIRITLRSEFPLDGVVLALAENGEKDSTPTDMRPSSADGLVWEIDLDSPNPEYDRVQLVASANQSLWYGDVGTKFIVPRSVD